MNTKNYQLIPHINNVIKALESGSVFYNWLQPSTCNCGLMAQSILNTHHKDLAMSYCDLAPDVINAHKNEGNFMPSWSKSSAYYCSVTGISINNMFKSLFAAGMTPDEIKHLEYLSDSIILKRSGIDRSKKQTKVVTTKKRLWRSFWKKTSVQENKIFKSYQIQENVVLYLKAWRDILVENQEKEEVTENASDYTAKEVQSVSLN